MIPAHHGAYVLDASVVAKWFVGHEEADRDRALALREIHITGHSSLFVPEFALLEILNAIRFGPKAKEEDGAVALELLRDLNLKIEPANFDLLRKANAIAWAYKIAIYDAVYVALAEQLGHPLITADDAMVKKLKGHSIVVPLHELEFRRG